MRSVIIIAILISLVFIGDSVLFRLQLHIPLIFCLMKIKLTNTNVISRFLHGLSLKNISKGAHDLSFFQILR